MREEEWRTRGTQLKREGTKDALSAPPSTDRMRLYDPSNVNKISRAFLPQKIKTNLRYGRDTCLQTR